MNGDFRDVTRIAFVQICEIVPHEQVHGYTRRHQQLGGWHQINMSIRSAEMKCPVLLFLREEMLQQTRPYKVSCCGGKTDAEDKLAFAKKEKTFAYRDKIKTSRPTNELHHELFLA